MTPRFDYIGMIVTDMTATLAFYRRLGLDVPDDADTEAHAEITLPNGMRLAWDTLEGIRSFDPDWVQPTGPNRINIAFQCATPAEVDKVYAELVGAGHRGQREPWDAFWGQRYATVDDPDGNAVDLYAPQN
jgi:catechol 2,3-dioxygenase-like lactoylglutathione lyase family enzyme